MCLTTVEYDCHHTFEEHKPCRAYIAHIHRDRKSQGCWKSLFRPVTPPSKGCNARPGRKAIYRKCHACIENEEWKRRDAEQASRKKEDEARRAAESRLRQRERANAEIRAQIQRTRLEHEKLRQRARRAEVKRTFRCAACIDEHRYPEDWERRANAGLCCARGMDEYEAWEKADRKEGYADPPAAARERETIPRHHAADIPRGVAGAKPRQQVASDAVIRAEARAAAERYGWKYNRSSAALEPDLVAAYINISGANTASLPPPPRVPEPVYQELLIDHDRWAQAKQTAHGRLPPEVEKPLPVIPLRPKKIPRKSLPQNIQTQDMITPPPSSTGRPLVPNSHMLSSTPSPPSSMAGPPRRYSRTSVSPLSAVQSPRMSRVMSDLGHEIDAGMRGWDDLVSPIESENAENPVWNYPPWNDYRR